MRKGIDWFLKTQCRDEKTKIFFFWYIIIIGDLIEGKVEGKGNTYLYIPITTIRLDDGTLWATKCEKTIKY